MSIIRTSEFLQEAMRIFAGQEDVLEEVDWKGFDGHWRRSFKIKKTCRTVYEQPYTVVFQRINPMAHQGNDWEVCKIDAYYTRKTS